MRLRCVVAMLLVSGGLAAAELPDLASVPADLEVPAAAQGAPAPGRRVVGVAAGFEGGTAHHTLYLPTDWRAGALFPVIVEYPGNGGYRNRFGDTCDGTPEGCALGFGLSGGRGFLWLCLPFVEKGSEFPAMAIKWWGDIGETKRYCLSAVREAIAQHGGDPARVVLCGFSRGSIACNYIGLRDDELSGLWCAFFCHSHYDGVRTNWPYPGADRASSLERLGRLGGRPQFIAQEGSTAETEKHLRGAGVEACFTFQPIPFRNHSDRWVLRDIPARRAARDWLARVTVLGAPASQTGKRPRGSAASPP